MSEGDRREGGVDRRATPRAPMKKAVSLTVSGELQGETVNMSTRSALIRATGMIHVLFRFQGQDYQARLVRVMSAKRGADCAIELRDPVAVFPLSPGG